MLPTVTRRARVFAAAAIIAIVPLNALPVLAAGPGLDPANVDEVLFPGDQVAVEKTVHTPIIPPKADIYFLADTTGSMFSALDTVKSNAGDVLAAIDSATADVRYGAGDYKDFPFDVYAFNNAAPIPGSDDDGAAALAAIAAWTAGGGNDLAEAQLYALDQISSGAAAFRSGSTPVVVWFGDAPGHDPVCSAISGLAYDVTEASVTAKLQAAGIRVVAISVDTGFPGGLDGDPTGVSGDYVGYCATIDGSAGQASRIAAATGGAVLTGVAPADIADAILEGLSNLPAEVAMYSDCSVPIHTTFSPAMLTVTSGEDAVFTETITVDDPAAGGTYECKDWATINGEPMTDSNGDTIYELKSIHVPEMYVTGGGQINTGTAKSALKVSFAGNVGSLVDMALVGHWETQLHHVSLNTLDGARFSSTEITSLVFSNRCGSEPAPPDAPYNWARWTAVGRVNGEDGWTIDVRGSDFGEPGRGVDSIRFILTNPSSTVVYDSMSDFAPNDPCSGVDSARRLLDAGNLQFHAGVRG